MSEPLTFNMFENLSSLA